MAYSSARQDRRRGWVGTAVALCLLVVVGFLCGALAGFLWEEPRLVLAYLTGETQQVEFDAEGVDVAASPFRAAEPPEREDAPLGARPAPEPDAPGPEPALAAPAKPAPEPAAPAAAPAPKPPAPAPKPAAAPAPKPVPKPPVARAPGSGFAVQVGAFSESAAAERLAARLREAGYTSYVTPAAPEAGSSWRVRVGPVADRAAAEALAGRLQRGEKLPTWVLEEGAS